MTRLLIEIGHPGHVHFFKNPINILQKRGWNVVVHARNKAECFELLRANEIDFVPGPKHQSTLKNVANIPVIVSDIYRESKRRNTTIMAGIGGCHAALASRLNRLPCVSYTDTEHAKEQAALYVPNCSSIHTPRSFKLNYGKKHHRYPGFHELAYMAPNYFKPNPAKLEDAGLLNKGAPIVLRIVGFSASHDFGVQQLRWETEFVRKYHKDYKIIISSEDPLPKKLEVFRNPLPANELHNLLAFSRLYIGAGATTASESAIIGTPALYTNPLSLGYLEEMEKRYGLVFNRTSPKDILSTSEEILSTDRQYFVNQSKKLLQESCDVSLYVADTIEEEFNKTLR